MTEAQTGACDLPALSRAGSCTEAARGTAPTAIGRGQAYQAAGSAFVVLFWIVGVSLWGLPFFYDFMIQDLGWTRARVTSGTALSRLIVGPTFGFLAGLVIDRFGPRKVMMAGILMAAFALAGLGGDYMVVPLMTAEIFGVEILGRLLGVILTAGGVAEAAAPWAVAHLRDVTGNYMSSCLAFAGVALLGGVAVLALPGRRRTA